jgi:hypothetical protein
MKLHRFRELKRSIKMYMAYKKLAKKGRYYPDSIKSYKKDIKFYLKAIFIPYYVTRQQNKIAKILGAKIIDANGSNYDYGIRPEDCIPKGYKINNE